MALALAVAAPEGAGVGDDGVAGPVPWSDGCCFGIHGVRLSRLGSEKPVVAGCASVPVGAVDAGVEDDVHGVRLSMLGSLNGCGAGVGAGVGGASVGVRNFSRNWSTMSDIVRL